MGKIWEHRAAYNFFRYIVDWNTRMSFVRLSVVGAENVPADGAVILASNHCNALMDALVILQARKGPTVFGARADIFKNKKAAAILRWLRIVPLARQKDGREELIHNNSIFDVAVEALGHRVPFCLFAEGTHRTKRSLLPIKKGVFRIAARALEAGLKKVYIVPVGLEYEDYFKYMGTCRMTYGKPIQYTGEEDTRVLTQTLHDAIAKLITYFPDDENYDKALAEYEATHRPVIKWWMYPLAFISLPLFLACAAICSPILLVSCLIGRSMEDKTWLNTIRYCSRLILIPWWPFHSLYFILLNFYRKLV